MNLMNFDIFVQICDLISHIRDLIKLEQLSKYYKHQIRTYSWMNRIITIHNHTDFVLHNYNFKSYDLCYVTDNIINKIQTCHTLNLAGSNITDKHIKKLKNCHTL